VRTSIGFALPSNIEKLTLLGKSDLFATGNGLGNEIKGNVGRNVITGGAGPDIMDAGEDVSRDTFVFRAASDSGNGVPSGDRISNFRPSAFVGDLASDLLDFHLIDADPAAGDQALRFVSSFRSASPSEVDGQLRLVKGATEVDVEIDINGDNKRDSLIRVIGIQNLLLRDLIL
jgi:hypothetical protein